GEGVSVILVGHTADDVLEAALMRADGSTTPDPKIWSPSPAWPEGRGQFLLRPLLSVRRQALRDWLDGQDASWIEDPGNADLRFARTRARSRLVSQCAGGVAEREVEPDEPVGSSSTPDGRLVIERADLGRGSHRFVAMALVCASGGAARPRRAALDRLLARLASGEDFIVALGGARIEADGRHVTFGREAGERARGGLAATPVSPRAQTVWDGRFAIEAEVEGAVVPIAGRMSSLPPAERQALRALPASARNAVPVFIDGAGEARLPRPFGSARACAISLVGARLAGACGRIQREGDIWARLSDNGAEGPAPLSWGLGLSDAGNWTGGEGRL
ncbi:MAG: ATP-binding protein, partial [Caulobacteraceae bacterium]